MRYGTCWTNVLASSAEHDAPVWVSDNGLLFAVFFLQGKHLVVAVSGAFAAAYAFLVVYGWSPRNFVSGHSTISFLVCFRHDFHI